MFKRQAQKHHINPRFRAYGKARIDIAQRAQNEDDWYDLWKESSNPFPFRWGKNWKQSIEYKVDDFAAEVGFLIDILGLPVNAFDPDYAMFTSPGRDFYFSVVPAFEDERSTPPDAIRIQFMVEDIFDLIDELEQRGVVFEQQPQPCEPDSSLYIAYFRTPHGICVDLWGVQDFDEDEYQDYPAAEDELPTGDPVGIQPAKNEYRQSDPRTDRQAEVLQRTSIQPVHGPFDRLAVGEDEDDNLEDDDESEQEDLDAGAEDVGDGDDEDENDIGAGDDEPRYIYDDEEEDDSLWRIRYS
jgi:catechol 2,3-dioxygenase-like lactoylglutathione lyase family enzyme